MARRREKLVSRQKNPPAPVRRAARPGRARAKVAEGWVRTLRLLGDPTRARVLLALADGEVCVGDLAKRLATTSSVISHQMRVLRGLGLVRCRRDGRSAFYALRADALRRLLENTLARVRGGTRVDRGTRAGGR